MPNYISWPSGFVIPKPKIIKYLLNPLGRDPAKARFFMGHGFNARWPEELEQELFAHTTLANFAGIRIVPFGFNLQFHGPINTPNRTTPCVETYWHLPATSTTGEATLATAYPC